MGTSTSQGSPRNSSSWKPIFSYYSNEALPEEGVIKEVWRASEMQESPLSSEIKSDLLFECYKAVASSSNHYDALNQFTKAVISSRQNSIVSELAKRAIPAAFLSSNPAEAWKQSLFTEVTKYVISRDASGFVGENFRNKKVSDLIEFKERIGKRVSEIVRTEESKIRNKRDWKSFVSKSISKLKIIQR